MYWGNQKSRGFGGCNPGCVQPCTIHLQREDWVNLDSKLNFGGGKWYGPGLNGGFNGDDGGPPGQPWLGPGYPGGAYGSPGIPIGDIVEGGSGGFGGPGFGRKPISMQYERRKRMIALFLGILTFALSFWIAYAVSKPDYSQEGTGCTQISPIESTLCLETAEPALESSRIRALVIFTVIWALLGIIGFSQNNIFNGTIGNPVAAGLLLSSAFVFITALYYMAIAPKTIHGMGFGMIILGIILLILLLWCGRRFTTDRGGGFDMQSSSWCC
jgi:hypothetical protein